MAANWYRASNALRTARAGQNLKDYLIRAKGKRTVIICTYREYCMKLADTIVWLRGLSSLASGAREDMFETMSNGGSIA